MAPSGDEGEAAEASPSRDAPPAKNEGAAAGAANRKPAARPVEEPPALPRNLALSPDGTLVAFAREDGTVELRETQSGEVVREFEGDGQHIISMKFSAEGGALATGSKEGTVRIWDMGTADGLDEHERTKLLDEEADLPGFRAHAGPVTAVALHPTGDGLATASDDGSIRVWQLPFNRPTQLAGHEGPVQVVAVNSTGELMATGGTDRRVIIWDSAAQDALRVLEPHDKEVQAIAFSDDGDVVATGDMDGSVYVWDIASGAIQALRMRFGAHEGPVTGLGFRAGTNDLFSAGADGKLRLWEIQSLPGSVLATLQRPVECAVVSDDGRLMAAVADDGLLQITAVDGSAQSRTLSDGSKDASVVAWGPLGTVYSGHADGQIRGWDVRTGKQSWQTAGHKGAVTSLINHPTDERFISGGEDGTIRVWKTPQEPQTLTGHSKPVRDLAISADGRRFVSVSEDNTVRLWTAGEKTAATTHTGHSAPVVSAAISPDDTLIATADASGSIRLWASDGENESFDVGTRQAAVTSMSFSADNTILVSGTADGDLTLWQLPIQPTVTLAQDLDKPTVMAFTPNGKTAAIGADDGKVRVWDVESADQLVEISDDGDRVTAIASHPSGELLAVGREPGTLTIYRIADGAAVWKTEAHQGPIAAVAFRSDGNELATGGADGKVVCWSVPNPKDAAETGTAAANTPTTPLRTIEAHDQSLAGVAYLAESRLASGGGTSISVWDSSTGEQVQTIDTGGPVIRSLVVAKSDGSAIAADSEGTVRIWSLGDGADTATLTTQQDGVRRLSLSSDEQSLAVIGEDRIEIWDVASRRQREAFLHDGAAPSDAAFRPAQHSLVVAWNDRAVRVHPMSALRTVRAHAGAVGGVQFLPEGDNYISAGGDHAVTLWNVDGEKQAAFEGCKSAVVDLALDRNGSSLAAVTDGRQVCVWEVPSRKQKWQADLPAAPLGCAFDAAATALAVACGNQTVLMLDADGGDVMQEIDVPQGATSVAFVGDGRDVLVGEADNNLRIYEGSLAMSIRAHAGAVEDLSLSEDGSTLASGGEDATVKLWNLEDGSLTATLKGHSQPVTTVRFVDGGERIVSGSRDKTVRLWNRSDESARTVIKIPAGVCSLGTSANGRLVAAGGDDAVAYVFDAQTGERLETLAGHKGPVNMVAFSGDGASLMTAGADKTIRTSPLSAIRITAAHEGAVHALSTLNDGSYAVTGGEDGAVKVWDAEGELVREFAGSHGPIRHMSVSDDARLLATASQGEQGAGSVEIWNFGDGSLKQTLQTAANVVGLAFSGDSQLLAVAEHDQSLAVHAVSDGSLVENLRTAGDVLSLAFAPFTRTMITGESDNSARVYQLALGETLKGHEGSVTDLTYTPDGQYLLSSGVDRTVREWDLHGGVEQRKFVGSPRALTSVILGGDGKSIAAGSTGKSVYVWHLVGADSQQATVRSQLALEHDGPVRSIFSSTDGAFIATGSDDETARVWHLKNGREMERYLGNGAPVMAVCFDPNQQKTLISCNQGGMVRIWERPTAGTASVRIAHKATRLFNFRDRNRDPRQPSRKTARSDPGTKRESQLALLEAQLRSAKSDGEREAARVALSRMRAVGGPGTDGQEVSTTIAVPEDTSARREDYEAQQVGLLKTSYSFDYKVFRPVKLAVSNDGKTVVAARKSAPLRDDRKVQGVVQAWDVPTGVQMRNWTEVQNDNVQSVFLSPNAQFVYTLPDMHVFELSTGKSRRFQRRVACSASQDGSSMAVGISGQILNTAPVIRLLDGTTFAEKPQVFEAYEARVPAIAYSPDGSLIAAAVRERTRHKLLLLDAETLSQRAVLEDQPHMLPWHEAGSQQGITQIAYSPDGQTLVTHGAYQPGEFRLVVWKGESKLHELTRPQPYISPDASFGMRFVGDSSIIVAENARGLVLGDVEEGQEAGVVDLQEVQWGRPEITLSADGAWLASGDARGTVALWNLAAGTEPYTFTAHSGPVVGLSFSQSAAFLVTAGEENNIKVWNIEDFKQKAERLKPRRSKRRRN